MSGVKTTQYRAKTKSGRGQGPDSERTARKIAAEALTGLKG